MEDIRNLVKQKNASDFIPQNLFNIAIILYNKYPSLTIKYKKYLLRQFNLF